MEGRKTHNSNLIFLFHYYILILILIFLFNNCILISIYSFQIPILVFFRLNDPVPRIRGSDTGDWIIQSKYSSS